MQIINRVPNFKDTLAHHIVSALEAHNDPAVLVDLMAVFQGELKIGRDGTVIGIFWTGINKNWHVVTTNRKIRKADDN